MTSKTTIAGALVLAGLALLVWGAVGHAQEAKQVMMVFTTDTNGEVNPCG